MFSTSTKKNKSGTSTSPSNPRTTVKSYALIQVILSSLEKSPKYNKADVYLAIKHGYEGVNGRVLGEQLIPLPFRLQKTRFNGQSIAHTIPHSGRVAEPKYASVVLSGSQKKGAISQLGTSLAVHVSTFSGDLYFELTPEGNIELHRTPGDLRLELNTFGVVTTREKLWLRSLTLTAKQLSLMHTLTLNELRATTAEKIFDHALIHANVVEFTALHPLEGKVENIRGSVQDRGGR